MAANDRISNRCYQTFRHIKFISRYFKCNYISALEEVCVRVGLPVFQTRICLNQCFLNYGLVATVSLSHRPGTGGSPT